MRMKDISRDFPRFDLEDKFILTEEILIRAGDVIIVRD